MKDICKIRGLSNAICECKQYLSAIIPIIGTKIKLENVETKLKKVFFLWNSKEFRLGYLKIMNEKTKNL